MKKYAAIIMLAFSALAFGEEQYNFELLRTNDNPIKVYVIFDKNYSAKLHSEILDGESGYTIGSTKEEKNTILNQEQSSKLLSKIYECKVWSLKDEERDILSLDGSQWSLSMSSNGKTHTISRWSPRTGCFFELGLFFVKLSGLKIEGDIY